MRGPMRGAVLCLIALLLLQSTCVYGAVAVDDIVHQCNCGAEGSREVPETFSSIGKYSKGISGVISKDYEAVLISQSGPGVINYFEFVSEYSGYHETVFRFYYDGETEPSFTANLFKMMYHLSEPAYGTNGKGSFFLTVPIPFQKSIKITAQIDPMSSVKDDQIAYWIVRGNRNAEAYVGNYLLPPNARLQIAEMKERTVFPLENVDIMDVYRSGKKGLLYSVQIEIDSGSFDFMEGPVLLTTGDGKVIHLGSALDDYLCSAWWLTQITDNYCVPGLVGVGKYRAPGSVTAYRLHERDLVFWNDRLTVSLSNGDESVFGGAIGNPEIARYSSRVWYYEW